MRSTPIALVLCLAGAGYGQTTTITSPPGFLTTEAGELVPAASTNLRMCRWFGGFSNYECQIFDDHLRGGGIKQISQIDFRSDSRQHSATSSMGRTWSNVTLTMALGSLSGPLSPTWTGNETSSAMVFSAQMSWANVTGNTYPSPQPNDWGVVSFPFSQAFVTPGATAVIQHYKFSGGVLANAGTWSGTTSQSYQLDAHFNDEANTGYYYTSSTASACVDSFHAPANFAYAYIYSTTYAANAAIAGERAGKIWFDIRTYRTAPLQPVLWAYSLGTASILFPIQCKNNVGATITPSIFVDLAKGFVTSTVATWDGAASSSLSFPYTAAAVGVKLYLQGAWADSVTGIPSLTRRGMSQIAAQPAGKMLCLYTEDGSTATTWTSGTGSITQIPLTRYTYR